MIALSHPEIAAEFPASEVEELLAAGAKVNTILPPDGWSFLAHASMWGNLPAARTLLKHGADPEGNQLRRAVPLHLAASNEHFDVVAMLLDMGADVNARDSDGNTALFRVLTPERARRSAMPETLVDAGIDPSLRNKDGKTALEEFEEFASRLNQAPQWSGQSAAEYAAEKSELVDDVRRVRALLR